MFLRHVGAALASLSLLGSGLHAQGSCTPTWLPFGSSMDNSVWDFEPLTDAAGDTLLCAGGEFTHAGGVLVNNVARWDGATWSSLGGGLQGAVLALKQFDDGQGRRLFAGGTFESVGGGSSDHIARWNGAAWQPVGDGFNQPVYALEVFDDGSGPALYAGGQFTQSGSVLVPGIARWDGQGWSAVREGLAGTVLALAVYDDGLGAGSQLYAGGGFQFAGGEAAGGLARWDGAAWHAVGGGLGLGFGTPVVWSLCAFDDGSGPRLFVGGNFSTAGGTPANYLAAWNGATWSAVGSGLNAPVYALHGHDDGTGTGPVLFVGGEFGTQIGDGSAGAPKLELVARWDGTSLQPMGSGLVGGKSKWVEAFESFDAGDGVGEALIVGGRFTGSGGLPFGFIVRWGGCIAGSSPWTDLGSALGGSLGEPKLVGGGPLVPGSAGSLLLSQAASFTDKLLLISLASTPAPFKGGVLVPVPVLKAIPFVFGSFGWTDWPAGVPSGTTIYLQYAILDPGAVQGVALSNALLAVTP